MSQARRFHALGCTSHKQAGPSREIVVLMIGAGFSGLLAAIKLGQSGVAYTVIEKDQDVGGTWFENTYPGCGVAIPDFPNFFCLLGPNAFAGHGGSGILG